jgi:predicted ferric reductase
MQNFTYIKIVYILFFILIIGIACTIPYYFESPSMYYKTGIDKLLLRSGKILGIIATILIFYQLVLISRFAALEKAFKMKSLFQGHRTSGLIILAAAALHPIFIMGADHFVFFPFESKYWPEITGIVLLSILVLFVLVSHWQKKIKLDYKLWRLLHKSFAPIIVVGLYIHIHNVSKTFESGLPFYSLTIVFSLSLILIVRKYLKGGLQ